MKKIREIIKFNKLLIKSLNVIHEEMCDILQNLTFYSQTLVMPKELQLVYFNTINLLFITIENYLNLFDHVDMLWYPDEQTGDLYYKYINKNLSKYDNNRSRLKEIGNYNKLRLVKFDPNDLTQYVKQCDQNDVTFAILYGNSDFIFKHIFETYKISKVINLLEFNMNQLNCFINQVEIEVKKLKEIYYILTLRLTDTDCYNNRGNKKKSKNSSSSKLTESSKLNNTSTFDITTSHNKLSKKNKDSDSD